MSPQRICIFHIGLPKTGTSSIQAFLRRRTVELLRLGIRFPAPGPGVDRSLTLGRIPHEDLLHHFYAVAHAPGPQLIHYDRAVAQSLRDPADSTLLLSHEMQALHGHEARAERFASLRETHDIRFICYLRDPLRWLASFYEQAVSQPNRFRFEPARHFAVRAYLEKGFRGLMAPFRDLGAVELHDFDSMRSGGGVVPHFLQRIGANALVPASRAAPRVNTHAFSPEQLTIMRQLKTQGVEAGLFLRARGLFEAFNATNPRTRSPVVMFAPDLCDAIGRQWQEDRRALGREVAFAEAAAWIEAAPYKDDPAVIEAMMAFLTTAPDAGAAAAIRRAVEADVPLPMG